jgi:predicted dehydrogenase
MDKIRYAIVGAGWISQEAFMPAVAATENSVMAAIVTGNAEARAKLAEFYGIVTTCDYDGYDALVASDAIDVVYVALPNSMHADYAIRAMNAGKHAIVEKPLAIDQTECEAMIAAAEVNGVFLMTAYRLHSEPMTVEVLTRLRAGEIGAIKHFSSTFGFQSADTNHRLRGEHWGGPLQDIGVYCLNAARQVMEAEPIEAQAVRVHGNGDPRFEEVEGSIAVTLRFPEDRLAQFLVSFEVGETDTYTIMGTDGVIEVEKGYQFQTTPEVRIIKGADVEHLTVQDSDHFSDQIAYFSDCIRDGVSPAPDGVEGMADVIAMRAIEEAARTKQAQPINAPSPAKRPGADTVRVLPRTDRRLVL